MIIAIIAIITYTK
jgi:hypothetical protein